jgi:hypothetical protein
VSAPRSSAPAPSSAPAGPLGGSAGGGLGHRVAARSLAARSPAAWSPAARAGGSVWRRRCGRVAARSPAARSFGTAGADSGGGFAARARTAGVCGSFYAGLAVADDPVARAARSGAPGPTNKPDAGEKGLLCQRPGRWRRGLGRRGIGRRLVAVLGSRHWHRHHPRPGPIPGSRARPARHRHDRGRGHRAAAGSLAARAGGSVLGRRCGRVAARSGGGSVGWRLGRWRLGLGPRGRTGGRIPAGDLRRARGRGGSAALFTKAWRLRTTR